MHEPQIVIDFTETASRSEHASADHHNTPAKLLEYFADDPPVASITRTQLTNFSASLTKELVSDQVKRQRAARTAIRN